MIEQKKKSKGFDTVRTDQHSNVPCNTHTHTHTHTRETEGTTIEHVVCWAKRVEAQIAQKAIIEAKRKKTEKERKKILGEPIQKELKRL